MCWILFRVYVRELVVLFFRDLSDAIFHKNRKEFLASQPVQYALGICLYDIHCVFDVYFFRNKLETVHTNQQRHNLQYWNG